MGGGRRVDGSDNEGRRLCIEQTVSGMPLPSASSSVVIAAVVSKKSRKVPLTYTLRHIKFKVKNAAKHFSHFTDTVNFSVKINYGKAAKNQRDFRLVLKVSREFDESLQLANFPCSCPATGNAQSLTVDSHVGGTSNAEVDDDCRRHIILNQIGRLIRGNLYASIYGNYVLLTEV